MVCLAGCKYGSPPNKFIETVFQRFIVVSGIVDYRSKVYENMIMQKE